MASRFLRTTGLAALAAGALLAWPVAAQDASPNAPIGAPFGDWLKSDLPPGVSADETYKTTSDATAPDPFAVLTSGALWEENHGGIYTRDLGDAFSLNCETSDVVFDENAEMAIRAEKLGLLFAPVPEFNLATDWHAAETDATSLGNSASTNGVGVKAEGHLPTQSIVRIGLNFERTSNDAPDPVIADTSVYSAQVEQPLGKWPVSAVVTGELHGQSGIGELPSLEQALVWKPLPNTTVQMGLRQQQYQEYPGVDHQLNEALFADWTQHLVDDISWHSYAELLNTRGLVDQAPVSAIASGAAGTPQANNPVANTGLTSSVPLSFDEQTVTFTTGPSFQLQNDLTPENGTD
jgi:hypothetical protein